MRRPGIEEWLRLIAEYEKSELTQKEFAAKHDVSLSTLQYHLYKRGKQHSNFDVNTGPRFLPVEVVASAAPKARPGGEAPIEVAVRTGAILRFEVGTDTRYLAELLAAIG